MSIQSSGEYEDKGIRLLRAQRALEALAVFEEGARRFPGDSELIMGAAMARLRLGEHAEACRLLEELRASKRASGEVMQALTEAYLARGLVKEAVRAADEAVKADARDERLFYRLARTFYTAKRYREALPLYERAAEVAPAWAEAWFGLGACQWSLSQSASAEAALRRAIELAPTDWLARQFLGCVLCDLGRKAEALAMLESIPMDGPWQKPALERLVALGWWPEDQKRREALDLLWSRVIGGAAPAGALAVLEEVSRPFDD
jgi:tetratricopeptide (TPR) repeat protein